MAEHILCKTTDLPAGHAKTVEVAGKAIAVYNVGGKFFATDNACVHHGGPLGEGSLSGNVVTCPWHGWQYDVTSGVSPVNPAAKVKGYKVKVDGTTLKVEF